MDYRRSSLVVNRQQLSVQSPSIYSSFAGAQTHANAHDPRSPPPNGITFESNNKMWWDDDRIDATVTRSYVVSKLRPDEAARLDEPLGFGDGLTDDTYWEWIESKAKRIFLILVELGVPDQIFGVIDDSWDDDDLPVPLDQVERLQLTYDRDEKLEKKFFHRQFNYLLRHIQKGEHVVYEEDEVIPLEQADKRPVGAVAAAITHSNSDKVHIPGKPDEVYIRRRIPLGPEAGRIPHEDFLSGIAAMKVIEHEHLTSLWASYIHQGNGFLLLSPVNDNTLKSYLTITPQSIKILAKQDRRMLQLNWLHCLADALAFLHKQGIAHRNIKPSNVMLDGDNQIFLGDTGIFPASNLNGEKRSFDKESYDYSAPEQASKPIIPTPILSATSRPSGGRRPLSLQYQAHGPGGSISLSSSTASTAATDTYSIHTTSTSSTTSNASHNSSTPTSPTNSTPPPDPLPSDIYSLGTIYLEILSTLLKRTSRTFSSHRSAKNKTPGRGGGLPDASFHKNRAQVLTWITFLQKDASKKEDRLFRGIASLLALTTRMLADDPAERPGAREVREEVGRVLESVCGIENAKIHCGSERVAKANEWNFGFDELRLQSQRAAAEACAAVAPGRTEVKSMSLGNGGVVWGVERREMGSLSGAAGDRDDGDGGSVVTRKSGSSEGRSKGSGGLGGQGKVKAKAKAWQAPVYAGEFGFILSSPCHYLHLAIILGCIFSMIIFA